MLLRCGQATRTDTTWICENRRPASCVVCRGDSCVFSRLLRSGRPGQQHQLSPPSQANNAARWRCTLFKQQQKQWRSPAILGHASHHQLDRQHQRRRFARGKECDQTSIGGFPSAPPFTTSSATISVVMRAFMLCHLPYPAAGHQTGTDRSSSTSTRRGRKEGD